MRRFYLILLAIALLDSALSAQNFCGTDSLSPELRRLVLSAPTSTDYPEAKGCYLLNETQKTIHADGKYETYFHRIYKMFTYKGKKTMSNPKFLYDTTYQEIKFLQARTINVFRDSSGAVDSIAVAAIDSLSVNEITPSFLQRATAYATQRQVVLSLPAVSESSIVEIEGMYRCTKKPPKPFDGWETLLGEDPIVKRVFQLTWDPGVKLYYREENGTPTPSVVGSGRIWRIENYRGYTPEPQSAPDADFLPTVFYSTYSRWEDASDMFAKQFLPKTTPTEAITSKVKELTAGKSGQDALFAIYDFLLDNMRYVELSIQNRAEGFQPNPAEKVLSQGYGDRLDMACLATSLIKAAGFEAEPLLVNSYGLSIRDRFPMMRQFTHILIKATIGGQDYYINPAQEYCCHKYIGKYAGEKGLLVSAGKGKILHIPDEGAVTNSRYLIYTLSLSDSGDIEGSLDAKTNGSFDCDVRSEFKDTPPRKAKMILNEVVSNIGTGAELTSDTVADADQRDENMWLELKFKVPKVGFLEKTMMIYQFPDNPLQFAGVALPSALEKRQSPIYYPNPFTITDEVSVEIPEGWQVAFVSGEQQIKNAVGTVSIKSSVKGNKVEYTRTISIDKKRIGTGEYKLLKKLVKEHSLPRNKLLLLEKSK